MFIYEGTLKVQRRNKIHSITYTVGGRTVTSTQAGLTFVVKNVYYFIFNYMYMYCVCRHVCGVQVPMEAQREHQTAES